MKKINKLIVFLFLIFNIFTYSQRPKTVLLEEMFHEDYKFRRNTYFKDINGTLNKYLGTWVYSQGDQYFKITFFKSEGINEWSIIGQKEDIVQSNYEYRLNGNIVFETYTSNLSYVTSSILYGVNILGFGYQEPSLTSCEKARFGRLKITFSLDANNQPILNWDRVDEPLQFHPIPCPDGSQPDITGFLVPTNMILTKL